MKVLMHHEASCEDWKSALAAVIKYISSRIADLGHDCLNPPPHRGQVKKPKENRNIGYVLQNVNIKRSIVVES
jgi:hypothetical protein